MMANLLTFINNDFFKLLVILSLFTFFVVLVKNFFDRRKLEKKFFKDEIKNNYNVDGFQHFNFKREVQIHAEHLDPKFELIAKLESVDKTEFPIRAIEELEKIVRVGQKSVRLSTRILGSLGNSFTFYVGMLLVNRHGSLSLIEHLEFTESLTSVANEFELILNIEEYSDVVKKIKPLKSKIYDLDGKLILTIRFEELPSKSAMNGFADKFSLDRYTEDRFVKLNKFGLPEFSIVPADFVYALNIVMDLPRVEDPEKVFEKLFETAEWLSFQFNGQIIDKSGIELKSDSKATILNQVLRKIQLLEKFGLIPGRELSMKVFN